MSGFTVDDKAVQKIAEQERRLAGHGTAGKEYIAKSTDLPDNGEGLINLILGGHRDTRALAELFHETLATKVAGPSADAFTAAADYYHRTDHRQAEQLDRTYPSSNTGEAKKGLPDLQAAGAPFADLRDPTARYTTPPDYSNDEEYAYKPALEDALSLTAVYRDAVWAVSLVLVQAGLLDRPFDLLESVIKPISGDWARLRACADVYDNVGTALGDMSANVQWTGQRLDDFWTGNAADSAQVYLCRLAKALAAAEPPFHELAEQYKVAAKGANELGDIVGGLICDLIDAVLILIATVEAAGASAATIVGIPLAVILGDAGMALEIIKIAKIIFELLEVVDKVYTVMSVFKAALGQFGRIIVPENMPRLDATGPAHLPR